MTCTQRTQLEAYALGQLDEAASHDVGAHLDTCAACAEEARWLTAERRLFTQRAARIALPPPPFAAVLAEARAERRDRTAPAEIAVPFARRAQAWGAIAAAGALLGMYVGGRLPPAPRDDAGAPAIVAEPPPRGETCEDPGANAKPAADDGEVRASFPAPAARMLLTPIRLAAAQTSPDEEACVAACTFCSPHAGEVCEARLEEQ